MALTCGFYNSRNEDRAYDAVQISQMFEGIINDGVYASVGNKFSVHASGGMSITVDTGRAWFNNTWTRNDALLVLTVPVSEQVLKRIDAVVLEVNTDVAVRNNTIKIVKGTPASSPSKPTLVKSEKVNQYPFAYITVEPNVTEITQTKIINAVGTSACPYVTGIIKTVSIDNLISQWSSEFNVLFAELEEQISQATSGTIIDGSVTRVKLANDALYSPVKDSYWNNVDSADIGKTILCNGDVVNVVINAAASAGIPVGAEFAVFNYSGSLIQFSGVRVAISGEDSLINTKTKTAKYTIAEKYGLIALKKIIEDSTNGDVWLITGNVEVST